MKSEYQETVGRVSGQTASEFLSCGKGLEKRALLPDEDIAGIVGNTGLETAKKVPGSVPEGCVNKKNMKGL